MRSTLNPTERNPYIDNLKGILITLVVIGHFVESVISGSAMSKSVFIFIYAFHMPLFLFFNGITFQRVAFDKNKVFSRSCYFLLLYLALKIIIFYSRAFVGENPEFHFLSESGIPWYLFTLTVYYFVSYLLRNFNKKYLLFMALALALLSGYDTEIGDFLVLSRNIVFYPCFLLGSLCDINKVESILKQQWLKVISVFLLVAFIIVSIQYIDEVYFLRPLFTGRNSYEKLGEWYLYGPCFRILSYTITLGISVAVLSLTPHWELKIITHMGRNSLQIYFWHRIVLYALKYFSIFSLLEKTLGHRYSRCVWVLCAIAVTWLLSFEPIKKPFKVIERRIKCV